MKPAVLIKCPNCQNQLRVPPDMADISVKCKHCGHILQLKKKTGSAAAPIAPPPPVPAKTAPRTANAAPAPVPAHLNGQGQNVFSLDTLPDYTPPAGGTTRIAPAVYPSAAPLVESLPETASSDYNPAFEGAGQRHTGRGQYKGPRGNGNGMKWIAVCSILVLGGGVFAAAVFKPDWFKGKPGPDSDKKNELASAGPGGTNGKPRDDFNGTKPLPENQTGPVPRRLLAVSVNQYAFANSLLYGDAAVTRESDRRDFYKAVERLADGWRIPKKQRYYLSDGPIDEGRVDRKHPPLKMVIEGTIDSFLNTCRVQDRIVIIFTGHAIEKDGEAYLVPIEGELEDVKSLIPLKDFYAKLGKCVAQEKLVIFDVCRFNPARGFERPAFGVMTEELEKTLHNCPDGVAVWTTCSNGQYSYEWEGEDPGVIVGLGHVFIQGSAFFSIFFPASDRAGVFGKRLDPASNIQLPTDPLPIEPVAKFIGEKTEMVVREINKRAKRVQTPKLTSKSRKEWVAYNPNEPLAATIAFTDPPPTAKPEEVAAMFKELNLDDIKAVRKPTEGIKIMDSFPFTESQLKGFFNDSGPSYQEIAKDPAKFEKDFPIRAATVDVMEVLRNLKQDPMNEPPSEFASPVTDATKKKITGTFQLEIARRQGVLEELRDKLEAAAKKKEMEKSKRWLANFDYAYAQVRARYAYIFEYNLALGNVKTDKLPELDPNQKGWKLASVEKMTSPGDIRGIAEEAKTAFAEMATTYANTPWAVMAKAQKNMAFGLKWEPAGGQASDDDMPAKK